MAIENSQKPPLWLGFETLLSGGPRMLLLLTGGIVVAAMLAWHVFETRFYRAAIPVDIGLTFNFATTGSNVRLWGTMFRFDRKACGGAIFNLSDTSVAAIRERGLDLLKNARQGRGYTEKADRSFYYYSYEPWQTTPLPSEWISNGTWLSLSCMGLKDSVIGSILDAAQTAGSFYTTAQSAMLMVVPNLKIAVYTYTH